MTVLSICRHLFTLDISPPAYADESFFSLPAARAVHGQPFPIPVYADAPYQQTVFAYHGPFFFRTQIPVLKLLGVSLFASRVADWVSGHLAVLLLALFLVRRRMGWGGLALVCWWAGDIGSQELLLGRPDGMSLFCLVAGVLAIVKAIEGDDWRWSVPAGFALGCAAGFSVGVLLLLPFAVLPYVAVIRPWRRLAAHAGACAAGGLVSLLLAIACYWPHLSESFEQLVWFVFYPVNMLSPASRMARLQSLFARLLELRAPYVAVLMALAPVWAVLAGVVVRRHRARLRENLPLLLIVVGGALSLGAEIMFYRSTLYKYYLIYLNVWIVLVLVAICHVPCPVWWRRARLTIALLIGGLWLTSLAWNVSRCREATFYARTHVDRAAMDVFLRRYVPRGVKVYAESRLFVYYYQAGLDWEPLPWSREVVGYPVPADAWLVLGKDCRLAYLHDLPEELADRPLVVAQTVWPGACSYEEPMWIYGPREGGGSVATGPEAGK